MPMGWITNPTIHSDQLRETPRRLIAELVHALHPVQMSRVARLPTRTGQGFMVGIESVHRIHRIGTHPMHPHTTILQLPSSKSLKVACCEVPYNCIRRILAETRA